MITIAKTAQVSALADIEDSVRGTRITLGENVRIDAFVKIKPVAGMGDVIIGDFSYVNSGTVIFSGNGVTIGANVLIAPNCTLVGSDHEYRKRDVLVREQRFEASKGGILIEDDVWIGANCVILEGSVLRKGCVVGAHSLVRGELEPYSVNVGAPVRRIGYRL